MTRRPNIALAPPGAQGTKRRQRSQRTGWRKTNGVIDVVRLGSVVANQSGRWDVYRACKAALYTLMRSFAARHVADPSGFAIVAPDRCAPKWRPNARSASMSAFSPPSPAKAESLGLRLLDRAIVIQAAVYSSIGQASSAIYGRPLNRRPASVMSRSARPPSKG